MYRVQECLVFSFVHPLHCAMEIEGITIVLVIATLFNEFQFFIHHSLLNSFLFLKQRHTKVIHFLYQQKINKIKQDTSGVSTFIQKNLG